jgi:hypothetical protein
MRKYEGKLDASNTTVIYAATLSMKCSVKICRRRNHKEKTASTNQCAGRFYMWKRLLVSITQAVLLIQQHFAVV